MHPFLTKHISENVRLVGHEQDAGAQVIDTEEADLCERVVRKELRAIFQSVRDADIQTDPSNGIRL